MIWDISSTLNFPRLWGWTNILLARLFGSWRLLPGTFWIILSIVIYTLVTKGQSIQISIMIWIPHINIFVCRFFFYLQIQICWCMGSTTYGNNSILDECCCTIISYGSFKYSSSKVNLQDFLNDRASNSLLQYSETNEVNIPEKFSKPRKTRDLRENRACTKLG